jgi:predicted RNA binding protein YcfA (HicA-like mRNA interferase family)
MTRLRPVPGRKLVAVLERRGFSVVRVTGSHHVLQHADGRRTVVPVHGSKDVKKGTLRAILSDCDLEWEELEALL